MRTLAICGRSHILKSVDIKNQTQADMAKAKNVAGEQLGKLSKYALLKKLKTKKAVSEHFRKLALLRWKKSAA